MAKSFISEIGDRLGGTGVLNTDGEHVKVISAEYYKRTDDGVVTNLSIQEALDALASRPLYTRATSTFGTQDTCEFMDHNGEPYTGTRQSITLNNNSYTVASGLLTSTQCIDIRLNSTSFPMAVFILENMQASCHMYDGMMALRVFNGNTELRRMYPLETNPEVPTGGVIPFITSSYHIPLLFRDANVIEVHILGDSYSIHTNIGYTIESLSI